MATTAQKLSSEESLPMPKKAKHHFCGLLATLQYSNIDLTLWSQNTRFKSRLFHFLVVWLGKSWNLFCL